MMNATVLASVVPVPAPALTLRRELGRWDHTAIGINQVIGFAVFILPSQVAAQLGSWSPIAFLAIRYALMKTRGPCDDVAARAAQLER